MKPNSIKFARRRQSLWTVVACLLACASLACAARPAWRFIKREAARQAAWTTWKIWQKQRPDLVMSGDPAFWLRIPSAMIDTLVVRDATPANLAKYPAVDRQLPRNIPIVLAHRDSHFRRLHEVQSGAKVTVETDAGMKRKLEVAHITIVAKDKAESFTTNLATDLPAHSLVLITCHPPNFVGPAPNRLIVTAIPKSPRTPR